MSAGRSRKTNALPIKSQLEIVKQTNNINETFLKKHSQHSRSTLKPNPNTRPRAPSLLILLCQHHCLLRALNATHYHQKV